MKLHLAKDFSLPIEAVTQTFALLAMTGAGKSNAAVSMAEEMFKAKQPWVAIDPKGDWYGIRSSLDGKGAGFPIPVFGGLHGDLPLESTAGEQVADLIVDLNLTCVLDVSEFSKAESVRFLTAFAERLFRRHGKEPQARHLFLEECSEYLPQKPMNDSKLLVGTWTKLVSRGRQRGLGVTLISQRSAVVNKDVLTQTGTLIALRATSPQDRKAIEGWVEYNSVAGEIVDSLPSLENGEAWVISPHFLKTVKKIKFRQRETFDSGATPVTGAKRLVATLADVDVAKITGQMQEAVERAKENDPAALKRRIRELEAAPKVATLNHDDCHRQIAALKDYSKAQLAAVRELEQAFEQLKKRVQRAAGLLGEPIVDVAPVAPLAPIVTKTHQVSPTRPVVSQERPARTLNGSMPAGGGLRRMLNVLGQYPDGRSRKQLALIAGLSPNSGTFSTYLGQLRSEGLMEGQPDRLTITPAGVDKLGPIDPLPQGDELFEYWCKETGGGMERMLRALKDGPLSREQLGEVAGMSANSGTFSTYLGRLRTLELIKGSREIALSEEILG